MGVKSSSNEENAFIPCECLDDHGRGMKSLESQVPPSDGLSVVVGESFPADFCLSLHYPLVKVLEGLRIKGLQKQGVHCGISFGYILGDDLQTFPPDGRHSAY